MKTILAAVLLSSVAALEPRYYGAPDLSLFPYDFGLHKHELDEKEDQKKVKNVSSKGPYHMGIHSEHEHAAESDDIKKVKNVSKKNEPDDYEVAENRLFNAVENAEKKVLHAVEEVEHAVEKVVHDEVDTLFHEREKHEKEAANVSAKGKKTAFVRGKVKKPEQQEENHHLFHHEFKPEVEQAMHELEDGDME